MGNKNSPLNSSFLLAKDIIKDREDYGGYMGAINEETPAKLNIWVVQDEFAPKVLKQIIKP